jgi:hypothetical protein
MHHKRGLSTNYKRVVVGGDTARKTRMKSKKRRKTRKRRKPRKRRKSKKRRKSRKRRKSKKQNLGGDIPTPGKNIKDDDKKKIDANYVDFLQQREGNESTPSPVIPTLPPFFTPTPSPYSTPTTPTHFDNDTNTSGDWVNHGL